MDFSTNSPWLGLASYEEEHTNLFFGRSQEIEELFGDIQHNTQTVIYGPSGTGKSSIIKAGIFGEARKKNFLPVYIRLNHNSSATYYEQIVSEIKNEIEKINGEIERVSNPIKEKEKSLWEFFHCNAFWTDDSYPLTPLIVIDQFEEIFTLTTEKARIIAFFEQLSDLFDDTIPDYIRQYVNENKIRVNFQEEINYRFVLSLREDFLARLEEFSEKIPSLRKNRYSLQAINEEQAMEIIMKPGQGIVQENVAIEIIKKITNNADFSIDGIPEITVEPALLSLFCSELNQKRITENKNEISFELIDDFGDDIIKSFYSRTISLVSEKTSIYLENVLLTKNGFRDSAALEDVYSNDISSDEIDSLQKNRIIRIISRDGIPRVEFTHDILCKVAKENRDDRVSQHEINTQREINIKLKRRNTWMYSMIGILVILISFIIWQVYDANYAEKEAYYATVIKKHGWFEGYNKISKTEASHRDLYFRFSKIGSSTKHWAKMKALDGYHNLTTNHNIGTYLINQFDNSDSTANSELREKLKNVCQWEFISDASGEIVTQEKAFDSDGDLIFCYNPTWIAENIVAGYFFDGYGLPIQSRKDGYDFVHITYDDRGYEVLFEFVNKKGFYGPNKDGAYKTEKAYRDDGLQIKEASLNIGGDYMIDRWGNCGWNAKFDKKGNQIEASYFDENENPIKIKEIGYNSSVIKKRWKYDQYGNIIEESYWTYDDAPDCNQDSIHRYVHKINSRGKVIQRLTYSLGGDLVNDRDGIGIVNYDYDKNGNQILFEVKNVDQEYVNNTLGNTKTIYKYIDNEVVEIHEFRVQEDSLYCYYSFNKTNDYKKSISYDDNMVRIDSFDNKGNQTLNAYFDLDMNPTMPFGYHKNVTQYFYLKEKSECIDSYFDDVNMLIVPPNQNWAFKTTLTDSTSNISIIKEYNKTKQVIRSYEQHYDSDFNNILNQIALNEIGCPSRNGLISLNYYNVGIINSLKGDDFSTFIGKNEFGEPAYVWGNNSIYSYSLFDGNGIQQYFDEFGNQIDSIELVADTLPFVSYCYVFDSISYHFGIREGDVLLKYGKWLHDFKDNNENFNALQWELISTAKTNKEVWLLRHNPEMNSSKVVKLNLPIGPTSKFGFAPLKVYYTQKEKERLNATLSNYTRDNAIDLSNQLESSKKTLSIVIGRPSLNGFFSSTAFYRREIKDPILLLKLNDWDIFQSDYSNFNIQHSQLRQIHYMSINDSILNETFGYNVPMGFHLFDINITKDEYNKIIQQYKSWKQTARSNRDVKWEVIVEEINEKCPIDLSDGYTMTKFSLKSIESNLCAIELHIDRDDFNNISLEGKKTFIDNIAYNEILSQNIFGSIIKVKTMIVDVDGNVFSCSK